MADAAESPSPAPDWDSPRPEAPSAAEIDDAGGPSDEGQHPQVAVLEKKLEETESILKDYRAREAAEGDDAGSAQERLANARKRREAARKTVQTAQAKLSALQAERKEKTKKLDKLLLKQNASKATVVNPQQALPSVALRGGGDAELVKEIEALMRENNELEEQLAQHDGTRLHLEKLQNEKRDTARRVKDLKNEEKTVQEQLEMKMAELQELQEQIKPSPVRARYEAEVARLRKEINAHAAARTHAERDAAVHSKRLLRVRAVLGGFLKAEGLKAQDKLPAADDELAGRLAEHIIGLADKVKSLEQAVSAREEKAASLQQSSAQAAEELRRLVARRGKEQRRIVPTGLLTGEAGLGPLDMAGAAYADAADGVGPSGALPEAGAATASATAAKPRRQAPKRPPGKGKGKAAATSTATPEWSSISASQPNVTASTSEPQAQPGGESESAADSSTMPDS